MTVFMFLLVPGNGSPALSVAAILAPYWSHHLLPAPKRLQAWRTNRWTCSARPVPIFMTLAWIPYSIIYFHMLAQYRTRAHNILLILTAAAMPTFYHFLLELNGMFVFHRWPWWGNFFYALIVFNGLGHLVYHRVIAKPGATVG